MLNTGIPPTFIRWIRSFFNDRRAHVQLFNVFSSSRHFTQGLPQGSVLAPLLFLFYVNNLASALNDDAVIALFADDASILTTAGKILIGNQKVRVNITPGLLGVILNRSLTFNAHLKKLTTSLASSICIIRATAHTSWGLCRSTLNMAFHALVRSKLDYAAPAWQPWLSDTTLPSLDCLQNHSLRLITGQLVSTPLEDLRLEANVQS